MLKRTSAMCGLIASLAGIALPAPAASFDVNQGLWGDTGTPNTLAWAIHQANTTPGADLIRLQTNVNVDQATPIPFTDGFLAEFTDPAGLRIQGNGFSIVGNPAFVDANGNLHNKYCARKYAPTGGDRLINSASSFANVSDNVSHVTIDRLVVDGLNGFLDVGKGTVVSVSDSTIKNAVNFGFSGRSPLQVQDNSVLNPTRVTLNRINPFFDIYPGQEYFWDGAIRGYNATLIMIMSNLDLYFTSPSVKGALNWVGGTANVVSSFILGEGISISDFAQPGVLNFVNSIFRPSGDSATSRLQAYSGGEANVIASTLQYDAIETLDVPSPADCPSSYLCNGAPLQAFLNGTIRLQSSAASVLHDDLVGIKYPYSDVVYNLAGQPLPGTLQADMYTYAKPVTHQDAASLKGLFVQPNLITTGTAYALAPGGQFGLDTSKPLPEGAFPILPGPLIGVVPDGDSSNRLINPMDQSVISTDVFGNPRTFRGRRDAGAVQSAPGPLPVLGISAALAWSRRPRRARAPYSPG